MAVPAWLVQSYCTFDSAQIAQALDWAYLNLNGADLQEAYGFALWYRPAMNRQNQLRVDRLGIKLAEQGGSKPVMQPPATMQGAPSMGYWGADEMLSAHGITGTNGGDDLWGASWEQDQAAMGQPYASGESYGGDPLLTPPFSFPPADRQFGGGGGFNWGGLLTPLIQAGAQIGSAAISAANQPQATPYMPPNVTAPPNYYAPPSPYGAPMQQPQINPATGQPYINPMTGQPYPMGTQINPMTGQPIYAAPSVVAAAQPMPQWLLPVGIAAGVGLLAFAMAK